MFAEEELGKLLCVRRNFHIGLAFRNIEATGTPSAQARSHGKRGMDVRVQTGVQRVAATAPQPNSSSNTDEGPSSPLKAGTPQVADFVAVFRKDLRAVVCHATNLTARAGVCNDRSWPMPRAQGDDLGEARLQSGKQRDSATRSAADEALA